MNKKFKLEGLLKLRKLQEQEIKIDLGKINGEIQVVEEEITAFEKDVEEAYSAQNKFMNEKAQSGSIQFFPSYIQGRWEDIRAKRVMLLSLKKKYQQKTEEMKTAMGKSKVVHNFKEKELSRYRKKLEKREEEKMRELSGMYHHQLKRRQK